MSVVQNSKQNRKRINRKALRIFLEMCVPKKTASHWLVGDTSRALMFRQGHQFGGFQWRSYFVFVFLMAVQ